MLLDSLRPLPQMLCFQQYRVVAKIDPEWMNHTMFLVFTCQEGRLAQSQTELNCKGSVLALLLTSCVTSLCLSFLLSKVGIVIIPTLWGSPRIK